jgi:hypothetical protein
MRRLFLLSPAVALSVSCTTLDQSLKLGATTGAITGAAAAFTAYRVINHSPTFKEVGPSIGIGLGLGLLTSYLIHQQVAADRIDTSAHTEIHFGDLPPSPFIMPVQNKKKGAKYE